MTIEEIEQLAKNIPEELYEIPQYGKLIHTISVYREVGTFFEEGIKYVILTITMGSVPIATFNLYEAMEFTFRLYVENTRRLKKYLKTFIPDILKQIISYLNILGFKEYY